MGIKQMFVKWQEVNIYSSVNKIFYSQEMCNGKEILGRLQQLIK